MKYYIDSEFIEDGTTIDLISIAIVAEDGRELYLVSSEFDETKANDFVKKEVLPHILNEPRCTRKEIRGHVERFMSWDPKPEIWAYYCSYDWIAFCQLFGTMMDLPLKFPRYCRDLKQLLDQCGNPRFPKPKNAHNALEDARWVRDVYLELNDKFCYTSKEAATRPTIKQLIQDSHNTAVEKGWWDGPERSVGDQFANFHGEISEAWEEYRKHGVNPNYFVYGFKKIDAGNITGSQLVPNLEAEYYYGSDPEIGKIKPEGIAVELADLFIRVFDTCGKYNIPLEEAIKIKMEYNKSRSYRHGNKKA